MHELHSVQLLLDAVSSFGAESIPFENESLLAIAATANKCLHGIPGLAMVLCRRTCPEAGYRAAQLELAPARLGGTPGKAVDTVYAPGQQLAWACPGIERAQKAGWLEIPAPALS